MREIPFVLLLVVLAVACGSAEPMSVEPAPDETTGDSAGEPVEPPGDTAGCPASAPAHGAPCTTEGQHCSYGGGDTSAADLSDNVLTCTCGGGAWSCAGSA